MIIVLLGVSGTGKSTIGKILANEIGWTFSDGDDFHSKSNVAKMASGQPLNDDDRKPWLASINHYCHQMTEKKQSFIIACSALKSDYRKQISQGLDNVKFAHLHDSYELIYERMQARKNHFMSAEMLQSQFDALEPCESCQVFKLKNSPLAISREIMQYYRLFKTIKSQTIVDGLMFPEAPRWHDGKLWYTDQHAQRIMTTTSEGKTEIIAETPDLPGGLGWLPDGSLLVVYMTQRKLYQLKSGKLLLYADLSEYASFHCNDMVVDDVGNVWVGNFGYDVNAGASIKAAEIIHVDPQKNISTVATDVIFPNGAVLSSDKSKLIVAETFAGRISQFQIHPDGSLGKRELWADLGDAHPDGICWSDDDCLWVAVPNKSELWKVAKEGQILAKIKSELAPYACMIGGINGDLLFITSSATSVPEKAKLQKSGRIEVCEI